MDITTTLSGKTLENPILPGSGPIGGTAEKLNVLADMGLGALVTKTITTHEPVLMRPFIYGEKNYIMNCEPWSEYTFEIWKEQFLPQVAVHKKQPLFVSLGYTDEDMRCLIPKLNDFADAYEISTHYVGKDLAPMEKTMTMLRELTDKPVYMKVSPHFPDPVAFAQMVMEHGGNGIVAVNSLGPCMKIDLDSRSVPIGNANGQVWLSGPAIKPIALALVNQIKRAVPECEIIGVGGVASAKDVLEFLLAGANAVEILSAALLQGRGLYTKIIEELPSALKKYHFSSIKEVVDTELQIGTGTTEKGTPVFDKEKCVHCGLCEQVCPFFAIRNLEQDISVQKEKCMGCGLCRSRCPRRAISGV